MESKNNQPLATVAFPTEHRGKEENNLPSPSSSGDDSVEDMQLSDREPSTSAEGSRRNCDNYNLRRSSVRVRVQVEQKKQQQPKQRKAKSRPPPLSKYRRRTANARERSRMAEINDAFTELKQALPQDSLEEEEGDGGGNGNISSSSSSSSRGQNSKSKSQPTKGAVLRLAIDYIAALRDILGYNAGSSSNSGSSEGSGGSSCCGGSSGGDVGDPLSDDLGSDVASSVVTPSTSSGSGDEESILSSDLDANGITSERDTADLTSEMSGIAMEDLDFFDSSLAADFSPDLSPDFTATLSPDEEVCLQLVTTVLTPQV